MNPDIVTRYHVTLAWWCDFVPCLCDYCILYHVTTHHGGVTYHMTTHHGSVTVLYHLTTHRGSVTLYHMTTHHGGVMLYHASVTICCTM